MNYNRLEGIRAGFDGLVIESDISIVDFYGAEECGTQNEVG